MISLADGCLCRSTSGCALLLLRSSVEVGAWLMARLQRCGLSRPQGEAGLLKLTLRSFRGDWTGTASADERLARAGCIAGLSAEKFSLAKPCPNRMIPAEHWNS